EIGVQLDAEWPGMTDGFQVIGHAGRTVDDADFAFLPIRLRAVVDDVPDFGKTSWLKAVAAGRRRETGLESQAVIAGTEELFGCEVLDVFSFGFHDRMI